MEFVGEEQTDACARRKVLNGEMQLVFISPESLIFRLAFAQIGELRSLIPASVNVIALTATATSETYTVAKHDQSCGNCIAT